MLSIKVFHALYIESLDLALAELADTVIAEIIHRMLWILKLKAHTIRKRHIALPVNLVRIYDPAAFTT